MARRPPRTTLKLWRGFHEDNLLFLFDEASGIPDIVFEVGMGGRNGRQTDEDQRVFDSHHIGGIACT